MNTRTQELLTLSRLALPIVIAQLAHVSLGMIDTIMVGPLGPAAISGIGIGNSIFFAIIIIGLGILLSMDSYVASAFGAQKPDLAHSYLIQGIWLALLASIPLSLVLVLAEKIFPFFGSTPDIVEIARPFLKMSAISAPFFLVSVALQRYWQARQEALIVTVTGILACFLNVIAIYAFVFGKWGFHAYGVLGVGFATLCCRIFIFVVLWTYTEIREGLFFSPRSLRIHWTRLGELLKMGLPSGIQCLLEVGVFSIAGVFCTRFGASSSAAHHVVLTIASFTFMFPLGIGSATAVRVGFHRGAGQITQAWRAGWIGILLASAIMTFFGILLVVLPKTFVQIFTQDLSTIELALQLMLLAALFQVFDGIQVATTGALRGMGNTTASMWMNLLGHYGIGLVLIVTLGHFLDWQVRGVWMGLTAGLMVVATALISIWIWMGRRLRSFSPELPQ